MSVPCGNQLTLWKLFFGLDDKELVGILWYTVVRNKSDAKSDPCEIDQKIVAAQLDFRNQIQLMLLEERMQKFTGCTFSVQHDDRITLQFFEGKLCGNVPDKGPENTGRWCRWHRCGSDRR